MSQAYIWDLTRRIRKGKKVPMWNATLWGRGMEGDGHLQSAGCDPYQLTNWCCQPWKNRAKRREKVISSISHSYPLQQSDKCLSALARMKWNQIVVHLPLNPTCEDGRIVSYPSLNLFLEWILWSRIPVTLGGFPSLVSALRLQLLWEETEATTSLCNLAGLLQNVRKPSQSISRFIQDTFHAKVKNSPLLKQDESPFLIQLVLTLCPNHLWSGVDPASSPIELRNQRNAIHNPFYAAQGGRKYIHQKNKQLRVFNLEHVMVLCSSKYFTQFTFNVPFFHGLDGSNKSYNTRTPFREVSDGSEGTRKHQINKKHPHKLTSV